MLSYIRSIAILVVIIVFLGSCEKKHSAKEYTTIQAISTSLEDVQAVVYSADDGDIILLPPGTGPLNMTLERPDYTPYNYPHPLILLWDSRN